LKKIIAGLLALCTFVLCIPMVMAGQNDPVEGDTTVSSDIDVQYIVSIPKDTNIPYSQEKTVIGTVQVNNMLLETGGSVVVTMKTSGQLVHESVASYVIPFTSSFSSQRFSMAEEGVPYEVDIQITKEAWEKAHAGAYRSDLVFEAVYESAE